MKKEYRSDMLLKQWKQDDLTPNSKSPQANVKNKTQSKANPTTYKKTN